MMISSSIITLKIYIFQCICYLKWFINLYCYKSVNCIFCVQKLDFHVSKYSIESKHLNYWSVPTVQLYPHHKYWYSLLHLTHVRHHWTGSIYLTNMINTNQIFIYHRQVCSSEIYFFFLQNVFCKVVTLYNSSVSGPFWLARINSKSFLSSFMLIYGYCYYQWRPVTIIGKHFHKRYLSHHLLRLDSKLFI